MTCQDPADILTRFYKNSFVCKDLHGAERLRGGKEP